jgi:hypothetical protein
VGTCLVGAVPEFVPIALRLATKMPNQDLSGAWITMCEWEPARASDSP